MIREFTVELTADDGMALRQAGLADVRPGKKTFAFDESSLIAIADGDFERFLWTAFDRVEERGGVITLAKGANCVFYLPVAKLQDADIRRAIYDFVTGRVGLNS